MEEAASVDWHLFKRTMTAMGTLQNRLEAVGVCWHAQMDGILRET
jgi:hypothetical protein